MIDVNQPITNPVLLNAITEMKNDNTDKKRGLMIDAVLKANFLCPAIITPEPVVNEIGVAVLDENTKFDFQYIQSKNGDIFYMAFTDIAELKKWNKDESQRTMVLTYDDFVKIIAGDSTKVSGFVINPYGDNIIFTNEIIRLINEKRSRMKHQQVVNPDAKLYLGQPEEYPTEMIEAITDHLDSQDNISCAYYCLMVKDEVRSHLLTIVSSGDKDVTFGKIADAAKPYLGGLQLNIVPYDTELGSKATQNVNPFFVCKR